MKTTEDTKKDVFCEENINDTPEETSDKTETSKEVLPSVDVYATDELSSEDTTAYTPDGRVMIEEDSKRRKSASKKKKKHLRKEEKRLVIESSEKKKAKYLTKLEKKARKRAKKDEKKVRKLEIAKIKASVKLAKPETRLEFIKNQMMTASPKELKKLKKKKARLDARIAKINLTTISASQRSTTDRLRVKIRGFHVLVTVLCAVFLIAVSVAGTGLYFKQQEIRYYSGNYYMEQAENDALYAQAGDLNEKIEALTEKVSALTDENRSLKSSNDSLESEVSSLEEKVSDLEDENTELQNDVDWLNRNIRIVVSEKGALYKTYHSYSCSKWHGRSYWAYNKEQVINNSEYTKCSYCQ